MSSKLPQVKTPMMATLIAQPFDDPQWSFETKWDGIRALCAIEGKRVRLQSRTGRDLLGQFPELASLRTAFTRTPVLVDGEICNLDARGRSSFQRLQRHAMDAAGGRLVYVAFDVLAIGTRDLRALPLRERQRALAAIVKPNEYLALSQPVVGKGIRLFATAARRRWEGIIGKRLESPYVERRSRDWVKIKTVNEQEAVIIGWTEPRGSRADLGALLLGLYEGDELSFAGKVGTGFDRATLSMLIGKLRPIERATPPLSHPPKIRAHWVKPQLVAEIRFGEWTRDGLMRQPVFLGLRPDKKPRECVRERPARA